MGIWNVASIFFLRGKLKLSSKIAHLSGCKDWWGTTPVNPLIEKIPIKPMIHCCLLDFFHQQGSFEQAKLFNKRDCDGLWCSRMKKKGRNKQINKIAGIMNTLMFTSKFEINGNKVEHIQAFIEKKTFWTSNTTSYHVCNWKTLPSVQLHSSRHGFFRCAIPGADKRGAN